MIVTLGFIALVVGIILIVCGYTVAPRALRPGFGATILGAILLVIGYLLPIDGPHHHDGDYVGSPASALDGSR